MQSKGGNAGREGYLYSYVYIYTIPLASASQPAGLPARARHELMPLFFQKKFFEEIVFSRALVLYLTERCGRWDGNEYFCTGILLLQTSGH